MPEFRDRRSMPAVPRAISSFIHMMSLRKHMTEKQKDEMYNLIKIHGFNEGFQKYLFAFDIDERKIREEKELLTYRYSIGQFPKPPKEPEYIEPNYKPSVAEIKTFKVRVKQEQSGVTMVLYERTRGWHIVLIEAPNLERPKVFMSSQEKSGNVMSTAVAFFVTTYKELENKTKDDSINSRTKDFDFFQNKDWDNKRFKKDDYDNFKGLF